MKKTTILCIVLSFLISGLWAQNQSSKMDSVSYNLGILIAQNLKRQGLEKVNPTELAKGVADALAGVKVDLAQCNESVSEYLTAQQAKKFEGNVAEGKKFLEENKKRPEVKTTASGLQYEIMKAGTGAKPTANDKVTVHYHGMLLNGFVFDSSVERGQPATFGVNQVIQGWIEGLQLMPLGSKWKFFIPYDLAYGERGAGGDIGPFATLIFEVELLKIN
ncbi:FKBP-type peptidyl-prolyl cis-trans isomerase [Haliscomenobacter hydrossis]|uniref:Peptidyl-prolyl cis-trans isomerase n=1 Tax=Haliscomenobacter hydrossis (strain ATCC 27775 / DSM 1100 / LMG 10767 / O) TaxID=760192 RepID=F4KPY2_HALH1|nr:FKBP-type peptidyl-prolyl cis-trans isomerase [Haliscomenobacter hydrossis]AEE53186.1 Peptidylprolyl isomerase [Haliscomenobacter hydrossis DSM 1100]